MITRIQQMSLALLLLRLALGVTFLLHGSQKVFGLFGGPGLQGFASWITTLHVPGFMGYVAALSELIGGFLLVTGIFAEPGALLIVFVMVGAIALVHASHGFFGPEGFEYPLALLIMALAIIIGGPGLYALWDPLKVLRH